MIVLGLIPARLGSKGVRRKIIRPLGGKPLIVHTIAAAKKSRAARVVVSTEAEEVAQIARNAGAEVPFLRTAALAGDTVSAMPVVHHVLKTLKESEGWTPDAVMYLQPTSPFRTYEHINAAIELLESNDVDSVLSMTPAREHPYYMFTPDAGGRMRPYSKVTKRPERRQDLPPVFSTNDAIMLSRTRYLLAADATSLFVNFDDFLPLPVEGRVTVDINDEIDFQYSEFLFRGDDPLA